MANSQYYSIFTTQGLALLREAIQTGTKLGITTMSFGDGNGVVPEPNADYKKLVREVYRTQLNRLAPSPNNQNWLEADAVIPSAIGGFNIREVGLWAGNTLVAYANYPATYKPSADQGTAQIKTIRIVLQIDNTANFELKIDASVVMATIQAVEDAKNYAKNYADTTKIGHAESIEDMLNSPPIHGKVLYVKSYYSDQNKGAARNYKFDENRVNENDKCTIINGWVAEKKDSYTVWDFGYKVGDSVLSTQAVKLWLESDYPCEISEESLTENNFLEVLIKKNKTIFGKGKKLSILNKVKIVSEGGSYIYKGFKIYDNGLNYAMVISEYDQVYVEDFEAEINYDTMLIWKAKSDNSKAIIRNCTAIKSARIGFTTDVNSKNVKFEHCETYLSRQGFHTELSKNISYYRCKAIQCGDDAPTPKTDQPEIYAGGFRFHNFNNVELEFCENIDKLGRNIDWLGELGQDLKIKNCLGFNLVTDDWNNVFSNIEIDGLNKGSIKNQNFKSTFNGKISIKNITEGGDIEFSGYENNIDRAIFENIDCTRLQISTINENSNLYMNNINTNSKYYCKISGFSFINIGIITYSWDVGDELHYPNLGYRFIGNNLKTFHLDHFISTGRGGGSQISLEDIIDDKFKSGYIGKLSAVTGLSNIDAFNGLDFNKYNITYSRPASNVANATGTDDISMKFNLLLESLKKSGYISG